MSAFLPPSPPLQLALSIIIFTHRLHTTGAGGNGGNAGAGGGAARGGSGGRIVLYTTDPSVLALVEVQIIGGDSGTPGLPGQFGVGGLGGPGGAAGNGGTYTETRGEKIN